MGAPPLGISTAEIRDRFATFWSDFITAVNPAPSRLPDACNPASLPWEDVQNTSDQFAAFINRFQMHPACRPGCLRENISTKEVNCRFYFPRPIRDVPAITREIDNKSWRFAPIRNHPRVNQCSPVITFGWMANTDIQPATTLYGLIEYAAKYTSKPAPNSTAPEL